MMLAIIIPMQNKSPVSLMTFVTQLQKVRKKLYKFGCCVPSCAKLVTEVYALYIQIMIQLCYR